MAGMRLIAWNEMEKTQGIQFCSKQLQIPYKTNNTGGVVTVKMQHFWELKSSNFQTF